MIRIPTAASSIPRSSSQSTLINPPKKSSKQKSTKSARKPTKTIESQKQLLQKHIRQSQKALQKLEPAQDPLKYKSQFWNDDSEVFGVVSPVRSRKGLGDDQCCYKHDHLKQETPKSDLEFVDAQEISNLKFLVNRKKIQEIAQTFLTSTPSDTMTLSSKFESLAIADRLESKINELVSLYNAYTHSLESFTNNC